jgi:hypothetical protein
MKVWVCCVARSAVLLGNSPLARTAATPMAKTQSALVSGAPLGA